MEAQWCWYCHRHDTARGIQSVKQQMELEEGAVEKIIYYAGGILSLENQLGQEERAIEEIICANF